MRVLLCTLLLKAPKKKDKGRALIRSPLGRGLGIDTDPPFAFAHFFREKNFFWRERKERKIRETKKVVPKRSGPIFSAAPPGPEA